MKEKQFYFSFNDYVQLFEDITGCKIKPERNLVKKRLERFFKKCQIKSDNIFAVEHLIRTDKECFNSFIDIFIPVESYFFREQDYLNLAIEIAEKQNFKEILVAPCATGETAYSLKILANEKNLNSIKIEGIDISESAIDQAEKGIFNEHSVKNLPNKYLQKYFFKTEKGFKVLHPLKENIEFLTSNLLTLRKINKYDIIICRNFLIYLKEDTVKVVLNIIYQSLKNCGVLILGKSELSLIKCFPYFKREEINNLLIFRKKTCQNS
ncbi:chemotaxis protein methyltransferase CheR [Thermotomaculum hydrothermale]|uniref:Chemotaxis protein methyltransferase CheR n=1 Tax=Thermotomaculum hydrothermale TaxID=981385 RepID=A0A7R6PMC0_9BACT|nr:CheR family methyltransferase [Thermotomaculum hydrothermale]BBB32198.1 chemotaxis protein methyltransferase CheR [Thermotomaculum hydrothermale]